MLDLITEYTSYAGRMLPLPDWVSEGVIAGIHGGKQTAKDIIQQLRRKNIPVAGVFLPDWTGQRSQDVGRDVRFSRSWWNWESDDDLYPEWDAFVQELANDEAGKIRVLSYVNPLLTATNLKPRFKKNLFAEAQDYGYLVKSTQSSSSENQSLSIKFGSNLEAGILDLTNPEARTWFKDILKEQVWKSGISGKHYHLIKCEFKNLNKLILIGLMADFGEHLPCDSSKISLHSGESASTYHNHYPEEWAQLHQEVVMEIGKEDEAVCFFRSGYTRSPGHMNLFWAGDQTVTWDQHYGIKSAVS